MGEDHVFKISDKHADHMIFLNFQCVRNIKRYLECHGPWISTTC